jgi:hypothetical protein
MIYKDKLNNRGIKLLKYLYVIQFLPPDYFVVQNGKEKI